MKHLIPETGDILKHITSGRLYHVGFINWSRQLDDYEVEMFDDCNEKFYKSMGELAKARWQIVTPESMNFM